MKYLIILFVLFAAYVPLEAQQTSGKVTYTYSTSFDGFFLPRQATLTFSEDESLFTHSQGNGPKVFDRNGQEISSEHAQKVDPTNKGQLFSAYMQDPKGNVYYSDFSKKKMIFREIVVYKAFLVEEPIWIDFKWKLIQETKRVGKFTCQKASTTFRGRTYTAWYAKEIPLPYGPWKFHGLPGLILEVSDEKGEVKFVSTRIEIPSKSKVKIAAPSNGESISIEGFMKAEYNIRKAIVDAQRASAERKAGQKQEFEVGKINKVEISLK